MEKDITYKNLMAKARAGQAAAKEARKEKFLAAYDCTKSLYRNCTLFGVTYNAVRAWIEQDENYGHMLKTKEIEYRRRVVEEIEQVAQLAAKGEIYTETTYRDGKGKIKQTATYQQQPSYKHAELILKAFDPDTYKPEIASTGTTININLLPAQSGQGQDISDYIDITSDPAKGIDLFG